MAVAFPLRVDPVLRVVSTAEILADVEAHPDAPPVTTARWQWLLISEMHVGTSRKPKTSEVSA